MDRRGHAMPGMDAIYTHVTREMRQRLCDALEQLWREAVAQRHVLATQSAVAILNEILQRYEAGGGVAVEPGSAEPGKTSRSG
jgi:hypothetical protein